MRFTARMTAVLVLLITASLTAYSQKQLGMNGPASVVYGETHTYSSTESFVAAPMWSILSGSATIHSTWVVGTTYYASVSWAASGKIAFFDEVEGVYRSKDVTVWLGNPTGFNGTRCNTGTVTLTATPGASGDKVRWYSVSSGGSHLAEANTFTTPVISATTTYYIETRNSSTGQLSQRVPITATVMSTLPPPLGPSQAVCALDSVTLFASPGAGGATCRWYNAPSGGTLLATGTSYHVPSVSGAMSFYVTSYAPDGGCESTSRTTISIAVNPPPAAPSVTHNEICGPGSVTLGATPSAARHKIVWYTSHLGGDSLFTGSTFTTAVLEQTTGYFVASYDTVTGCYSPQRLQVVASVHDKPSLAAAIAISTVYGSGSAELWARLGMAIFLDGAGQDWSEELIDTSRYQVHWYATLNDAEAASNKLGSGARFSTPPIGETTWFYMRAQDKLNGCYGDVGQVMATVVPFLTSARIQTDIIRVAGIKNETALAALGLNEKTTRNIYLDGRAQMRQEVVIKGSPGQKDIVFPKEYDSWGRSSKEYLPYVAATTDGSFRAAYEAEQSNFYAATGDKVADDAAPYAISVYEDSPLARLKEQGGIGAAHQPGTGHTGQVVYGSNTGATASEAEEVRILNADGSSSGFYAANALGRVATTGPDGNTEIVFSDGRGNVIARKTPLGKVTEGTMVNYIQTYYYYNDLGQLVYIIQPKGVAALRSSSWAITQAIRDQYMYQFRYDKRGRVTEKKIPGAGWQYIVYDQLNRPVLTQDAGQRATGTWAFVKYDYKGRAILSGYYTNTGATRSSLQASLDQKNYNASDKYFEVREPSTPHGYSNVAFPETNTEIRTVSYFDDHDFDNNGTPDQAYAAQGLEGEGTAGPTLGLLTGSKVAVEGTADWLVQYIFYDGFGRVIQRKGNNHRNLTISSHETIVYDFEKPVRSKVHHDGGTTQVNVVTRPVYDHGGRTQKIFQRLDNGGELLVAQYEHNALGQVVDKKLHGTGAVNAETFLQSVDYRYDIQGRLLSINNAQLGTGTDNDETGDLFGLELVYHQVEPGLANTARFDGHISAMKWKGPGAGGAEDQKSYAYNYDKSGKLESATYKVRGTTGWSGEANAQDELISYDLNGNIRTLQRRQRKYQFNVQEMEASFTDELIDDLTYTYSATDANSLSKITDASGASGFNNGSSAANNDYTYDSRGNLLSDLNKGISNTVYNHQGKPVEIQFSDGRKITYVYDAGGVKLSMKAYAAGDPTPVVTDYVAGFVYIDNTLQFFGSPEGRVVKSGGSYEYQYAIADHQGNTRVVFSSVTPALDAGSTGFESDPGTLENFPSGGNLSSMALYNHTPGGTKSQLLNGGHNSQVGVAKSFAVYPGDKVKITAYAKYASGGSSTATGFATALLQAFSLEAPAPGEVGTPSAALNTWGGFVDGGVQEDNEYPQAFVNIIVYDKDHNFLDAAWDQVDAGAEQVGVTPNVAHDQMTKEYMVKEAGFVYLYVSNNSPVNVYFDDVSITHTPTNVIQYSEYYPFGLQASTSWTREDHSNDYLYNAGNELNPTTGWYEMFYRSYDPAIGRMLQVDPYAAMYASHSAYNYGVNNPVMMNDPSGGLAYGGGNTEYVPGMNYNTWRRSQYDREDIYLEDWAQDFWNSTAGGRRSGYLTSNPEILAAIMNSIRSGDGVSLENYEGQSGVWIDYPIPYGVGTIFVPFEEAQQEGISITVTDNIVGSAWVKGYPNPVSDGKGNFVFYEVPTYEMIVSGVDNQGNPSSKIFSVIRFGVQHTGTSQPFMTGLTNAGTYDGTWGRMRSGMEGLHLDGASNGGVYIHAGPINNTYLVGAIKCIELCGPGSWSGFNAYINTLGGRSVPAIITLEAAAMPPLVQKGTYKP